VTQVYFAGTATACLSLGSEVPRHRNPGIVIIGEITVAYICVVFGMLVGVVIFT
jgi:hypothetical protein